MIRAENSITFMMKQHVNYMYKYVYITQAIHANNWRCQLKSAFRNNYSPNVNMCRDIIEIKYIKEKR